MPNCITPTSDVVLGCVLTRVGALSFQMTVVEVHAGLPVEGIRQRVRLAYPSPLYETAILPCAGRGG